MEKLLSRRCGLQSVPESYILPPESRPDLHVPLCETIPVIDLGGNVGDDREKLVLQIIDACKDFGFFQVINHGISNKLMHEVMGVAKEFFQLPEEEMERFYSDDIRTVYRLYTGVDYLGEKIHYWRDKLRHPCHPLEQHIENWPAKPTRYRELVGRYSVELRKLGLGILEVICQGLGLESGYLGKELSEDQLMIINHYPPCPDPSLTLGLPPHSDPNLLTLLIQGEINGLQVLKDGKWLAVEPIPDAIVVNLGHILHIISNGKLKSADHRVITNASNARTTVTSFIQPTRNCLIEPAKALVTKSSPQLYRDFLFSDFIRTYVPDTGCREPPLEQYKFSAPLQGTSRNGRPRGKH